jgi:hypothetical protein
LEDGGEPFVLAGKRPVLREAVTSRLRDPTLFWEIFAALPTIRPLRKEFMPDKRRRELFFRVIPFAFACLYSLSKEYQ